jgi:hypothetical protein
MPFETGTTPFTGDNNFADFMTNVYIPFARDDVLWSDNQAPILSPEVAAPEGEFWLSRVQRVGSPSAEASPYTTQAPYVFWRTDVTGEHVMTFTGFGVDDTQECFDQPNNPMNCPAAQASPQLGDFEVYKIDYGPGSSVAPSRCIVSNEMTGTYDKYWLFADTDGRYVHCVIKQSNRQYRHFHVGLITPLHPDLDPESFYVTGQFWDQLGASQLTTDPNSIVPTVNGEHAPYDTTHRHPFGNSSFGNELDNSSQLRMQLGGNWLYMPGLVQHSPEVVWFKTTPSDALTWFDRTGDNVRKHIGDVNNATGAVEFGCAEITGFGGGLGEILFSADRTFTSNAVPLIPIYVGANVTFASIPRMGVVGQIPDVFRINMANLAAEEEITVGTDTYVVFPLINKDSANVLANEGYSGYEGLAYKKITDPVDV